MVITLKQTIEFLMADIDRRICLTGQAVTLLNRFFILFNRGVILVAIYRFKRYFYHKKGRFYKLLAWLLRFPEFHLCHAEIDPRADIGRGFVLNDDGGMSVPHACTIGKNCTFMGRATPTLGAMEDVNHKTDRIVIGDYCVLGHDVRIINPVTIASGTQIKAHSVVMSSVATEGSIISGFPARKVGEVPLETVMAWSPIIRNFIL